MRLTVTLNEKIEKGNSIEDRNSTMSVTFEDYSLVGLGTTLRVFADDLSKGILFPEAQSEELQGDVDPRADALTKMVADMRRRPSDSDSDTSGE